MPMDQLMPDSDDCNASFLVSSVRENGTATATLQSEDPYPSLSDFHDYEPNLEFDDTEVACTAAVAGEGAVSLGQLPLSGACNIQTSFSPHLSSPISDGTIEENFEAELGGPMSIGLDLSSVEDLQRRARLSTETDFKDIARHQIVDIVGDDSFGRKLIVVYACRMPHSKLINHNKFLSYLMFTLNQYVEQDYILVYFHYGLSSKNKPSLSWMWQAYKAFDRNYKKNLKSLYLVHPTSFIRFIYNVFRPAISVKFGKKLTYINSLCELSRYISLEKIYIPEAILRYDQQISSRLGRQRVEPIVKFYAPVPTQQFGVTLQFIKQNNAGDPVACVVKQCVNFLSNPDMLETEGLFRRSANVKQITKLKTLFNSGESVTLDDPHATAVLLKLFFRELNEPLLTWDLYNDISHLLELSRTERTNLIKTLILERLPEDNYVVLKFLVKFLVKVSERSDLNKMTNSNLAVVFGPNLLWHENLQMSLAAISPINTFVDHVLQHHESLFIL